MSLMSALYVGRSGLQTSQNALNTVAHNISNADTNGFTRQQVLLGSMDYNTLKINVNSVSNQQIGLGVAYTSTRQVRDTFLDQTFRKESGRSAFYEVSYTSLVQIEDVLGESNDSSFQTALDNLWSAVQELTKHPNNAVNQGLLVERASQFLKEAGTVSTELKEYQANLNTQVKDNVSSINQYGKRIKELNEQILKIEAGGVESANDLRDERNYCLDQLGTLCNMSYSEDVFGNVEVQVENEDFVTRDHVYEMGVYTEENGFYTPYWTQLAGTKLDSLGNEVVDITNARVVDTSKEISTDLNTDIGKLEGLLYARGDHQANYTDLAEDKYDSISSSVLMNVQAEFDQLIHSVVTGINDTLAAASDSATGYLCNEDGSPIQLFEKRTTDNYIYDETTNTWTKVAEDPDKAETLYTVDNLIINGDLKKQPTLLNFMKPDGSEDQETVKALAALFDAEIYTLNPNVKTKANFSDYYQNLINQVANSGSVYKSLLANQDTTVSSTESARQQIAGVSTDEELSNMIRFQNAYNASSRYINAVNELLENLINSL